MGYQISAKPNIPKPQASQEGYSMKAIDDFIMRDISKMRNFVRAPLSEPDMSVRCHLLFWSLIILKSLKSHY